MKKYIVSVLTLFLLFVSTEITCAEVNDVDRESITNKISIIQDSVGKSDSKTIINILSPNAPATLKQDIQKNIEGKEIFYQQTIESIEQLDSNKINVKGQFSAKGINWNISGISNYFVFENIDNDWYLVESDFAQKLSAGYVFEFIGKIFMIIGPVILLLLAFWIWMLIDILNKPIENKTPWLLTIIFLSWFGAILYFFIPRRKYLKNLKQGIQESSHNNY
ncbi:MAG: PLD nuclease N-terminal domain-containing protein [Candidatus Gracilibacteria bacterium]|nr:PLD nuclease N-terminal domain-containing protein [Candidatus Gracilibacteria bacterium]MDD4530110.1 PLD nuclease N-terminal domain-containing protein [Candidatus Gracilibacteria bacterium]